MTWWTTELSDLQRHLLKQSSLEIVSQTLIDRFKIPASTALNQVNKTYFAYLQIRNGIHISEYLATCFRLARHAGFTSEFHVILTAWNTLDPQIRLALDTPLIGTTRAQLMANANSEWSTIYDLATRFKALPVPASITSPKPPVPSSSNPKPSGPYISRPYAPAPKQLNNKAYMAVVAGDRVYQDSYSQNRYLQYEDNPIESPDQDGEVR
jgi:hypothetical protein